jgi:hypothetical protein
MIAAIKQARDTRTPRMGFEELGMTCAPGAVTSVPIPYTNKGWQHGLDDEQKRQVERHFNRSFSNRADDVFWAAMTFDVPNDGDNIDMSDPEQVLKVSVLKQLGHLTTDPANQVGYKFILFNQAADDAARATNARQKAKAIAQLDDLAKDAPYIVALARIISGHTKIIDTVDGAFVVLYDFIEESAKNVKAFSEKLDPAMGGGLPKERAIVICVVRDAVKRSVISFDRNNNCYTNRALSGSNYGRTEEDVVSFLLQDTNVAHLGFGNDSDEPYAIRRQLATVQLY